MIITYSLSTIMAAESRTPTKNPKTQTIIKMLERITHLWVPSHKAIPGNKNVAPASKEALNEDIPTTEIYLRDDLKKWLTEADFKKRDQRWKNGNNEMKKKKPDVASTEKRIQKECQKKSKTQNRVYEGHPRPQGRRGWQSTMLLLQHRSIRRPHTVGTQRN
jgi:hypothetical protein